MNDTDQFAWRKSSRSYGAGECVEVASCPADPRRPVNGVLVRDSKLGGNSPVLAFTPAQWESFAARVKNT